MFSRESCTYGFAPGVPPDDQLPAADYGVDRDTLLASASRACCCLARPAVVVLMPPTTARPHYTDLLLCRHHYRVSRKAIVAAGAVVLDPEITPAGTKRAFLETRPSSSGH